MLNKIFLQGRLVADPELRHTQQGTPVASFRLAVDRDFKSQSTGERGADFINIVAWRSTAEFVSRYFNKGRMALVEGRLQMREYTDRTATAGLRPRWWPTIFTLATPAATASQPAALPTARPREAVTTPTAQLPLPPAATRPLRISAHPPLALPAAGSRNSVMMTANCRSKRVPVTPYSQEGGLFSYGL